MGVHPLIMCAVRERRLPGAGQAPAWHMHNTVDILV